jgi:hypothetical protein
MTYANWTFGRSVTSLRHILELPVTPKPNCDLYLQLYDGNIDATGQYYGIQPSLTRGEDGRQVGRFIFSAWKLTNLDNVRLGPGAHRTAGTETDPFVSVRLDLPPLPRGHYRTELRRAERSGNSDWFDYYVTIPSGKTCFVGGIRFPRAVAGIPAQLTDDGGSWLEFWDNNAETGPVAPIPTWSATIAVTGNNKPPRAVRTTYSARPDGRSMPQSNITVSNTPPAVHFDIGEHVVRVNPPTTFRFTSPSLTLTPSARPAHH